MLNPANGQEPSRGNIRVITAPFQLHVKFAESSDAGQIRALNFHLTISKFFAFFNAMSRNYGTPMKVTMPSMSSIEAVDLASGFGAL
jgi:hypothetical protein